MARVANITDIPYSAMVSDVCIIMISTVSNSFGAHNGLSFSTTYFRWCDCCCSPLLHLHFVPLYHTQSTHTHISVRFRNSLSYYMYICWSVASSFVHLLFPIFSVLFSRLLLSIVHWVWKSVCVDVNVCSTCISSLAYHVAKLHRTTFCNSNDNNVELPASSPFVLCIQTYDFVIFCWK